MAVAALPTAHTHTLPLQIHAGTFQHAARDVPTRQGGVLIHGRVSVYTPCCQWAKELHHALLPAPVLLTPPSDKTGTLRWRDMFSRLATIVHAEPAAKAAFLFHIMGTSSPHCVTIVHRAHSCLLSLPPPQMRMGQGSLTAMRFVAMVQSSLADAQLTTSSSDHANDDPQQV